MKENSIAAVVDAYDRAVNDPCVNHGLVAVLAARYYCLERHTPAQDESARDVRRRFRQLRRMYEAERKMMLSSKPHESKAQDEGDVEAFLDTAVSTTTTTTTTTRTPVLAAPKSVQLTHGKATVNKVSMAVLCFVMVAVGVVVAIIVRAVLK